jgi:hypothetical protein
MERATACEDVIAGDKLAALAARTMAAVLAELPEKGREKTGLMVGTTLGCLEADREFDRSRREAEGRYASPAAFTRTLPSTIAAEMAIRFGLRGPSLVVSAGAVSTAVAIRRALRWMEHFKLEYCIAAGMDWREADGSDEGVCLAVVVLLGRRSDAVVSADAMSASGARLGAASDESLHRLADWVRHPRSMELGAGVSVSV